MTKEEEEITIALHGHLRDTIALLLSNRIEKASFVLGEGKYDVTFTGDHDALHLVVTVSKEVEDVSALH